ncbi:MAG: hypothetical protein IJO19_02750 [Clostridia bacterium]|nr:hypothetical protein [Clostridia bacterium]
MYRTKPLFPYADGYYAIFPKGLENREVGEGSIVVADEYIIYFKPDTPENIKQKFVKDYAEYYEKQKQNGIWNM